MDSELWLLGTISLGYRGCGDSTRLVRYLLPPSRLRSPTRASPAHADAPTSLHKTNKQPHRTILKLFDCDHKEYKGTLRDVDTQLETEDGVEEGLFFRIL